MTKLEALVAGLKQALAEGNYRQGTRFPSEYELAELYGVNKTTANKAVGLLVNEGYLERAPRKRSGTLVRSLVPFNAGLIAFITRNSEFFSTIVSGAVKTAYHKGYVLSILEPEFDDLENCLARLKFLGCKGILTNTCGILAAPPGLPVVYVDKMNLLDNENFYQVRSDCYSGGRMIAERMLSCGHREIAYFTNNPEVLEMNPRRKGFTDVMLEHGISDFISRSFIPEDYSPHSTVSTLTRIFTRYPETSAIACDTDGEAMSLISAGKQLGIDLPERISLSGFGNLASVQCIYKIATVDQHPFAMGVRGCEKLIELIEHRVPAPPPVENLPVEFLPGESIRTLLPKAFGCSCQKPEQQT